MTDEMKPYIDHITKENTTDDTLKHDTTTDLNEGFLRGLSAFALINKVRKLNVQIKTTKSLDRKIDLIGEQGLTLSLLVFAMSQFRAGKK